MKRNFIWCRPQPSSLPTLCLCCSPHLPDEFSLQSALLQAREARRGWQSLKESSNEDSVSPPPRLIHQSSLLLCQLKELCKKTPRHSFIIKHSSWLVLEDWLPKQWWSKHWTPVTPTTSTGFCIITIVHEWNDEWKQHVVNINSLMTLQVINCHKETKDWLVLMNAVLLFNLACVTTLHRQDGTLHM